MSRCREHGVTKPCPLCAQGAWPLRDLNAVADFAGNPVDRPDGLVPGRRYVRLSEVVRSIRAAACQGLKMVISCAQPAKFIMV